MIHPGAKKTVSTTAKKLSALSMDMMNFRSCFVWRIRSLIATRKEKLLNGRVIPALIEILKIDVVGVFMVSNDELSGCALFAVRA